MIGLKAVVTHNSFAIKNSPDDVPEGKSTSPDSPLCNGGLDSPLEAFLSAPVSRSVFVKRGCVCPVCSLNCHPPLLFLAGSTIFISYQEVIDTMSE
ncbi:hypothetical protein HI914_02121 [Erysiphe necator]|nr:hypothetical protein HI914_02121 [Erysiphe necator]